jgi:hypothetical protein
MISGVLEMLKETLRTDSPSRLCSCARGRELGANSNDTYRTQR